MKQPIKQMLTYGLLSFFALLCSSQVAQGSKCLGCCPKEPATQESVSTQSICACPCNYGQGYTSCDCDMSCSCRQIMSPQNPELYLTRKKMEPSAVFAAIANMCIQISNLVMASKARDKQAQGEAIVNMTATVVNFAAECAEKSDATRNFKIKSDALLDITGAFLKELNKSSLTTQTIAECRNQDSAHEGPFIIAAENQEQRELALFLDYGKNVITKLEKMIYEINPEEAVRIHAMLRDLLSWMSNGALQLESSQSLQKQEANSETTLSTKNVRSLQIINKSGKTIDLAVKHDANSNKQ